MPERHQKPNRSAGDVFFDTMGSLVPNCGTALRLVELGQERPLSLRERFILAYNSPLCLHCNCNRGKFDKARSVLREIDQERGSGR